MWGIRRAGGSQQACRRSMEKGQPQGLKPASLLRLEGTAEAVPFPKPIHKAVPRPIHAESAFLRLPLARRAYQIYTYSRSALRMAL